MVRRVLKDEAPGISEMHLFVVESPAPSDHHLRKMDVQEELLQPHDPLDAAPTDYELAVLHVAWNRNSSKHLRNERTLLFAWIELLPKEVPPPIDDGEHSLRLKSGVHYVYVRHLVVPAERAVRWYLSASKGEVVVPGTEGEFSDDNDPAAKRAKVQDLGEEPTWPMLLHAIRAIPFSHDWHSRPRTHHLIPSVPFEPETLWGKRSEKNMAFAFLREHFHFSFDSFPEYFGSAHLVAPNPVFRDLLVHPEMDDKGNIEATLIRFVCRSGYSAEGLTVLIQEERELGLSASHSFEVRSPIVRVSFGQNAYQTSETVCDPRRGILYHREFMHFNRSMHMDMPMVYATRTVSLSTSERSYKIGRARPWHSGIVGPDHRFPSALSRLGEARRARERRHRAEALHQHWFLGQELEAAKMVRRIIGPARREVLIVDPYLGAAQLREFALTVSIDDAPIMVLTSANFLSKQVDRDDSSSPENGDELLAEYDRICKTPHMNPLQVRVMVGKNPDVHDRFLVVDEEIWHLGSSLNEFGSRGTMMMSVPNPGPIRDRLFDIWSRLQDHELKKWVTLRRQRRKSGLPLR